MYKYITHNTTRLRLPHKRRMNEPISTGIEQIQLEYQIKPIHNYINYNQTQRLKSRKPFWKLAKNCDRMILTQNQTDRRMKR